MWVISNSDVRKGFPVNVNAFIWLSSTMIVIKLKDTNIVFFLFQNMILDFESHYYLKKYKALSVMRKMSRFGIFSVCAFNMKVYAWIFKWNDINIAMKFKWQNIVFFFYT